MKNWRILGEARWLTFAQMTLVG